MNKMIMQKEFETAKLYKGVVDLSFLYTERVQRVCNLTRNSQTFSLRIRLFAIGKKYRNSGLPAFSLAYWRFLKKLGLKIQLKEVFSGLTIHVVSIFVVLWQNVSTANNESRLHLKIM